MKLSRLYANLSHVVLTKTHHFITCERLVSKFYYKISSLKLLQMQWGFFCVCLLLLLLFFSVFCHFNALV